MTPAPELVSAAAPHETDQQLVARLAAKFRWDKGKLAATLTLFGPLPLAGQEDLANDLAEAFGRFQSRSESVQTVSDSVTRKQLLAVKKGAKTLLGLLGLDVTKPIPSDFLGVHPSASAASLVSILDRFAGGTQSLVGNAVRMRLSIPEAAFAKTDEANRKDRHSESELASIRAELKENSDRCDKALIGVWWIHERAEALARSTCRAGRKNTHGGARRSPDQMGQLVRDALVIYAAGRKRNPDSGNRPGFGGPMLRFVKSVAELFDSNVTDAQIKSVWIDRKVWGSSTNLF